MIGVVVFLLIYHRRTVGNLKAEINHVVSYMSGEPNPGNFDNPVYQFQGNGRPPSDTSILVSNGTVPRGPRIPPRPANMDRYRDDMSVGSSRAASYFMSAFNADPTDFKNFQADMTNPNFYEAVKDHVYDEIKHKDGVPAGKKY